MLVFWEQRLVILATPKTGSTAIEAALEPLATLTVNRPPVLKHTPVQRFHRFIGPYLEATSGQPFTVVALMREPRDWLGSWFRYRQRPEVSDPAKSTAGMDFDRFVNAWCDDPQPEFAAVGSQAKFLQPKADKGIDRLFRYEEIGGFLRFLEDRLDCAITLPRLNVSPPGSLDLSARTEARLRQAAARDFALYDTLSASAA